MSMDAAALARLIADHAHRCRRQLPRRAAGRSRQRHPRRASRFRRAAAAGDPATAAARSASIHISIPGAADEDRTAFSRTKREAERLIAASGIPYAILRPGFVIAPSAYGGSAMLRALAALPIDLPAERGRDAVPAGRGRGYRRDHRLARRPRHRRRGGRCRDLGPDAAAAGHARRRDRAIPLRRSAPRRCRASRCPAFLLDLGAKLGDLASRLGWMPPMRSDRDRRIAPRRHRRSRALDGRDRHRAEDASRRRWGSAPPPSRTNGSRGCS